MQGSIWISVFAVLIIAIVFGIIPVYRKNESYFGVRISQTLYTSRKGRYHFRHWCLSIMLFTIVMLVVLYLGTRGTLSMVWFDVSIAVFILVHGLFYARTYTRLKEDEVLIDIESPRTAASLEVRKLRRFLNPWIELAALFLILCPAILLILKYNSIPSSFPIHWNFRGVNDGMINKSVLKVFFPIGVALAIYLIIQIVSGFVVKAKITLPDKNSNKYHQLKLNQLTVFLRIVDLVKLVAIAELGATALAPLFYKTGKEETLLINMTAINTVLFIVIVTGVSLLLIKNRKINDSLKALAGTANIGYRSEAKYWKWGIFYINPHDPAIWVEKRDGLGYTVNLGRIAGKWFIGVMLVLSLIIVLYITLLS